MHKFCLLNHKSQFFDRKKILQKSYNRNNIKQLVTTININNKMFVTWAIPHRHIKFHAILRQVILLSRERDREKRGNRQDSILTIKSMKYDKTNQMLWLKIILQLPVCPDTRRIGSWTAWTRDEGSGLGRPPSTTRQAEAPSLTSVADLW